MSREIPPEDQARIAEFLEQQADRPANSPKPKAKDRRQAESLKSGKLLTPQEAIALAISQGAKIEFGSHHYLVVFDGRKKPITFRPQQKTLDPGTCSGLKKFLGLK